MDTSNQDKLAQLKNSRRILTNTFSLLIQGKYEGHKSEAVFEGLKMLDGMVTELNNEINLLEPVKSNEPVVESSASEAVSQ